MNVVSLKGPGSDGGISTALEHLHKSGGRNQSWWYLAQDQIRCQTRSAVRHIPSENIPAQIGDAHYQFCHSFIWPIMHSRPEQACYKEEDFFLYKRLNTIFANQIERLQSHDCYFVQSYELALVPKLLKRSGRQSVIFWPAPWPQSIPAQYSAPILEIAESLLAAKIIAFYTKADADNFNNFIDQQLPYIESSRSFGGVAKVIVAPMGIDSEQWKSQSRTLAGQQTSIDLPAAPYVLSIDPCDPSSGVELRLKAIDLLFTRYPELKEQLTFVQICGRTSPGIKANDSYWKDCQEASASLNSKHATTSWKPLVSLPQTLSTLDLTSLYSRAAVMLVTAVHDGLNLSAQEFIASQSPENPGILVLADQSSLAKDEEFARAAITFKTESLPNDYASEQDTIETILAATLRGLRLPTAEKQRRMEMLTEQLQKNNLQQWCNQFTSVQNNGDLAAAV